MARISTAERIARYMAKHPGATMAEARGHGRTGEHGIDKPVSLGNNQVAITFRLESKALQAMRQAERIAGDGGRVKMVVTDKNGNTRELFANSGHLAGMTASELLRRIEDSGVREVAEEGGKGRYLDRHGGAEHVREDDFDYSAIREYQLIVQ